MADNLRISMVQSHIIWEDRDENLGYYGELLRRVSGKTDIAVLPETFTTGFSMDVEKLADTMDGPTIPTIKGWAKKYKLAVAGSFIAKEGGKYFNRAFFVTPEVETIEPLEQKMIAKASRRVGYRNRSMLNSSFTLTREAIRHPS